MIAVNLRNNFNDVLSASLLAGSGNVFAPLEGDDGSVITAAVRSFYCDAAPDQELVVVGGTDVITDAAARDLAGVVAGQGCG